MVFKTRASIDPNQHKGLILLNSITGNPLVATGLSLTNAQPIHVAIVDGSGSQVTSFGGTGGTSSSFGSAFPATGTAAGAIDASGNMAGLNLDGSGNLKVSGSLSVGGTTDNSAFTAGTTTGTPTMGFYHSTIDTVTDGRAAAVGITNKRAMLVTLQTSAGADTGVAASPLQVSLANTASNSTAVKVDGSAVTQPISGTVAIGAGSAVIGHVITDTGSTTAVTGTVTISGAVTNAGTFAVQDTVLDAAIISQEATTSGVKGLTVFGAVTTNAPTYTTAKSDALSLDTSGLLRVSLKDTPANTNKLLVTADAITFASPQHIIADSGTISTITNVVHVDDNAGSLTVDNGGTFAVQAAQSGTWTVQPGNTANTTAWKVDGSAVTQPVSGTITANAGSGTFTVAGNKTNNNAAPGATNVGALVGIANAASPTYTEGDQVLLSTDLSGNVRVTGSLSVGGTTDNSAYTAGTSTGTPSMGFYHSTIDTVTDGRAATVAITNKRAMMVNLQTAAGVELTNTSNALDINIKSGNLTTLPVTNAGTFAVQATLQTQTDTVMVGGVNIKEINAVTPLMGNGTTGTGSLRVTIASDNTAFSVNSTLSAETTKVIGVVRTADGAGNLLTSTGNALDINIKSGSIANTTFGATQATASSLNATVVQGTAAALSAGWPVLNAEATDTTGTFTNATQTNSVTASSLNGYANFLISINGTYGTATAVFEGSDDGGTTWYGISEADRTDSNIIESGYTSLTNTTRAWQISNPGWDSVRVRSTAVASGTVNIRISPSAAPTAAGASVSIGTALPAGSAVIGHVITDTGSTTAVTGTVTVSGTVSITANSAVNVAQINGVTPLMGNGTTGTGSQRVTIASDNTAFSVNATLAAETTKAIGVVRISDGAGNLLTSNSSTFTAKFGLDSNLLGTLGTAFSTAGKVDVKGADGDVFVRQATGSNLHTVLDSGTLTTLTGITNTVVTDDLAAAATGAAVPANAHYQGLNAQTALPAAASAGNLTGETGDKFGRQVMLNNAMRDIMGTQTTTITSSTSETTIVTAIASTFNDLVSVFISNTSATATRVDIRDVTAGSVIFQLYIPAGDMRGLSLTTPWPQTSVNTAWTATCGTSVADIRVSALYIKNK